MIPIYFDVVSLYTNIGIEEAVVTVLKYVVKPNIYLYGFETQDLWELLHMLLDKNVFKNEGHILNRSRPSHG